MVVSIRVRVNIKGQSKGVVPDVTIELDGVDDKVNTNQSDEAVNEAKRIFINAETFCMGKMR